MITEENFITQANLIHKNSYTYDKVIYINKKTKVKITCLKHGDFLQMPEKHLTGQGCPSCNESRGEKMVKEILDKNNVTYEIEKTFKDCFYKKLLKYDFYLPYKNICIEYDGEQHYKPKEHFGGIKTLIVTQKRDLIKNEYCIKNNIRLIRIPYTVNKIEDIEEKLNDIFVH